LVSGNPSHDSAVLSLFAQLYALMHTAHFDDLFCAELSREGRDSRWKESEHVERAESDRLGFNEPAIRRDRFAEKSRLLS
jgi:hypothetical protein